MNSEEKLRRSSRLAGAAAVISGSRFISFNLKFLAERLSMPLLRKNVKTLYENAKNPKLTEPSSLSVAELSRSIRCHLILQVAFVITFIYSLLVSTRGVAALVKFDVVTLGFFAGPLILIISTGQLVISTISLRAQRAERDARCTK